ncbi:UDP-2,4-diacetamido-2,4,6-trideoxy-beta-L-altropyranose hydrolase [Acetivibrio clariflavus]|uniref:UDP-2,4-diacetamido-2,4, 6-trideoxy-beta-L-altropyranose hydrolase n=1 Tax=Acetivibrio clariflavus TaxID=288965 RepID=UPI0031F4D992
MIKVAIRADGSKNIGMGHVMRCLSLAKGFRNSGIDVLFLSKYEQGILKIREEGFEAIEFSHDTETHYEGFCYGGAKFLGKEAEEIIEVLKDKNIDVLFIDSYNVSEEFFLKLKPFVKKLCYIDDINKFSYPVDVLINGNITGEYLNYESYYKDEIMLLGLKYNLIREEFKGLPDRKTNRAVKEIMITTGGSDPFDLSYRLSQIILSDSTFKNIKINIVAGSGFENIDRLRELKRKNTDIEIYENVSKMSEIMLKSDVAISAGGSTLYELCACGTPTLAVIVAENQRAVVDMLCTKGYIESLGWYNNFSDEEFLLKLKNLCENFEKREHYSKKMQKLVDGNGVKRIVDTIVKISS